MSPTWHEEAKIAYAKGVPVRTIAKAFGKAWNTVAFAVDHNSARACHRGRLRKAGEAGRQYRVDNPRPDAPNATKRRTGR